MKDIEKEFKPTSWSIDNKIVIYVATAIICLAGISTYNSLPKENFPEVVFPQIYVATVYPGAAPEDMEKSWTELLVILLTPAIDFTCFSICLVTRFSMSS